MTNNLLYKVCDEGLNKTIYKGLSNTLNPLFFITLLLCYDHLFHFDT